MNLRQAYFILLLTYLGTSTSLSARKDHCKIDCFSHNIQLQLADSLGFPVDGTEFWVTLDILKIGPWVTIQLPLINFQTGQISSNPREIPFLPPLVNGGYLITKSGFLPRCIRPNDLVPQAIIAASNNGLSQPFSLIQDPTTLPNPPAGYIVEITQAGAINVQCAGTFGNIIPVGPQILMPTTISYRIRQNETLCKNMVLSNGFTNTTEFTGAAADSGFRDSHVNDAFDSIIGWSWTDNSMIADKTNGTMNAMVAIGRLNKKGKLKVSGPIQLTNLATGVMAWDTAVAINRTNKNNVIVSYGVINNNTGESFLYRAVSFNGGVSWPVNGPLNVQPVNGFGDARGVASDKFGNIWYSATSNEDLFTPAVFYCSTDGGVTFERIYSTPDPLSNENYDYPQFCFGGDASGNYGLYFQCTLIDFVNNNQTPTVGFIPITGLGQFGTPEFTQLPELRNSAVECDITAAADGRVWQQGIPNGRRAFNYVSPIILTFKSPGAIDKNYAGAWDTIILDDNEFFYNISDSTSQPIKGYIFHSTQSILFDERRQALYAVVSAEVPDGSENMRLFFTISRDHGQTWSNPIDISTSSQENRGYQSMALDEVTGDLYFGWYDGRNDDLKSVEYFAARLQAKDLTNLVQSIPLSNPLFADNSPI